MSKKEQVSMFIDDTTLSEILNVAAEHTENQTIGNMSATIQRYQVSVQTRKWS
jgi:hypothetical protein